MKTKTIKAPDILMVQILEAKPNKMFTEDQRRRIRFLRYNQSIPCAACGRKSKLHWTALYQFKAGDMDSSFLVLKMHAKSFPPLTPVCGKHPLAPDFPKPAPKIAGGKRSLEGKRHGHIV